MADWHLKELRDVLENKGWRIIAELPGDSYAISASWKIRRSNRLRHIFIDFEGLDDMTTLPIERSYACHIRGQKSSSLYFARRGEGGSAVRQRWIQELDSFARALDQVSGSNLSGKV